MLNSHRENWVCNSHFDFGQFRALCFIKRSNFQFVRGSSANLDVNILISDRSGSIDRVEALRFESWSSKIPYPAKSVSYRGIVWLFKGFWAPYPAQNPVDKFVDKINKSVNPNPELLTNVLTKMLIKISELLTQVLAQWGQKSTRCVNKISQFHNTCKLLFTFVIIKVTKVFTCLLLLLLLLLLWWTQKPPKNALNVGILGVLLLLLLLLALILLSCFLLCCFFFFLFLLFFFCFIF